MSVLAKVQADLDALVTTHPMGESLAQVALELARRLDDPDERAPAAVAKELRATLIELAEGIVDDADDFAAGLSAPSRDETEP